MLEVFSVRITDMHQTKQLHCASYFSIL